MIKKELEELEAQVMEVLVRRRQLGGYNAEAETIVFLCATIYKIAHHLTEQAARKK